MRFLYVMDPMCAWCYGFKPELEQFLGQYPSAETVWIMGGLAPDNDQPMAPEMQQTIAAYWRQIEEKTQVSFNHDYWLLNTPYRSTYQACRAVIVAETIQQHTAAKMANAIQSAYYREAKNPSLNQTLFDCANLIGLDVAQFQELLLSAQTEQKLQEQLSITQQLQVGGFPALFYLNEDNQAYPLALGYCTAGELTERFSKMSEA